MLILCKRSAKVKFKINNKYVFKTEFVSCTVILLQEFNDYNFWKPSLPNIDGSLQLLGLPLENYVDVENDHFSNICNNLEVEEGVADRDLEESFYVSLEDIELEFTGNRRNKVLLNSENVENSVNSWLHSTLKRTSRAKKVFSDNTEPELTGQSRLGLAEAFNFNVRPLLDPEESSLSHYSSLNFTRGQQSRQEVGSFIGYTQYVV